MTTIAAFSPQHRAEDPIGVLLVNSGSPDSLALTDVRDFLRRLLSGPVPALNARVDHAILLRDIIVQHCQGWLTATCFEHGAHSRIGVAA